MASFRCYDNFDVIVTLILKNFHLHLIQLGNFGKSLFMATWVFNYLNEQHLNDSHLDKYKLQVVIHHQG